MPPGPRRVTGFTRAVAEVVVVHASLRMLASLVAKYLIRRVPETGRDEIHELLRLGEPPLGPPTA